MLRNEQFNRTRQLALRLAGIELFERHRELLDQRSRRMGIPDSSGLDSLLDAVENGDAAATQQFITLLTTKFTGFFRHPRHFEIAAEHALRSARQRDSVRLWSAACATGQEPWSLAMSLLEVFRCDDPPVNILASDVDMEAIAVARQAEYHEPGLRTLSPAQRERFLTGNENASVRRMTPVVRRLVEFQRLNLTDVAWPVEGPFEVIFCRNVLMYLEACHRYAVLERMASLLAPGGLLILDPAEHAGKAAHWFTLVAEGIYSRRGAAGLQRGKTRGCVSHP